ncbi:hypothetical protein AVEN_266606-1 [Araneus ventricosus]|uniref:Uncharacterized protein n=1 Tax=Araneus ventricosus TaxID=182803 RepID=A0A4Y2TTH8_ARAVE|nr:hypothetical protein AVEN_266606-1 [Araneus ventricosus]
MYGTCWEDGLQVAVCHQTPSTSSNKAYYRNGHYCHNKRSTTLLPACLAVVKHAFRLEGIIPVIIVSIITVRPGIYRIFPYGLQLKQPYPILKSLLKQKEGAFGTDLMILSSGQMTRRHLSCHHLSKFPHHTSRRYFATKYDLTCNKPHTQWNRVSNLEPSDPEAEMLTLGHPSEGNWCV